MDRTKRNKHASPHTPSRLQSILGIISIPIAMSIVGLFFVFEASSVNSFTQYGDSLLYLMKQATWLGIGLGALICLSIVHYEWLRLVAVPFMGIIILLLIIVLVPHIGSIAGGASSWIDLGFFNVQPTEFAKVATVVYLATWFMQKERKRLLHFCIFVGVIMLLVLSQPDMGTAIIILAISLIMYFIAGKDLLYLFLVIPLGIAIFGFLIAVEPYRMERLTTFLNPSVDPEGVGYHINQILISLSNGGLMGQGFGVSRQKYLFLPEAHTDSIFAIIGEELGFIGSVGLIFFFMIFLWELYKLYESTSDRYAQFLIGGVFAFFGVQIIVNLGGMVALLPLTGVPLPFISYGGSNLITSYMLVGIAVSVALRAPQKKNSPQK